MLTYTGSRNLFGTLARDSAASVLTVADTLINEQIRFVSTARQWWFLEKLFTLTTQASTQFLDLPGHVDRVISDPFVTVSSTRYKPKEAPSRVFWDQINYSTYTSDIPEFWYQFGNQFGLWPTPATAGNTITIPARQKIIELSIADYTTGHITTTSTTSNVTTVTGAGGASWGTGMIGQWLRITPTSAAGGGDGVWYQIASVPTSSTLTLENPYGGTALSSATAAYTIGQASLLPEAYQSLPVYLALNIYFTSVDPNESKATLYAAKSRDLYAQLVQDHSSRGGSRVLDDGEDLDLVNPNLTITA